MESGRFNLHRSHFGCKILLATVFGISAVWYVCLTYSFFGSLWQRRHLRIRSLDHLLIEDPPAANKSVDVLSERSVRHASPKYTESSWVVKADDVQHRLMICAKVGNETPYLLEWIEFHRLQGVTKFALYVDDLPVEGARRLHTNQISWFPRLYRDKIGVKDLIDIHSAQEVFTSGTRDMLNETKTPHVSMQMHRLAQQSILKHCHTRYEQTSEWIAHVDVDEFLYSPTYDTLTDYFVSLYGKIPLKMSGEPDTSSNIAAYRAGNLTALYVWPVNYGLSNGNVFEQKVALSPNAIRGDVEVLFDPRFGRKDTKLQDILPWLRLTATKLPLMGVQERKLWFDELLRRYGPQNNPNSDAPDLNFLDKGEVKKLIDRVARDVVYKLQHHYGTEAFWTGWVWSKTTEKFPLLIESQIGRMTSTDYGDSYTEVAEAVIRLYPECEPYVNELLKPENSHLREKVSTKERIAQLGEPPRNVCVPGNLPTQVTNVGKSITWTGRRFKPPLEFKNWNEAYPNKARILHPTLRNTNTTERQLPRPIYDPEWTDAGPQSIECASPWVHHCAHKTEPPTRSTNVTTELRMDHHMFRSLEARVLKDHAWRTGDAGYGKLADSGGNLDWNVIELTALKEDPSKLKFVYQLRERLSAFEPTPVEVSLKQLEPERHPERITPVWHLERCSTAKLLTGQQKTCPHSHPYVGFLASQSPPPHPITPFNWCTTEPHTASIETFRHYDEPRAFGDCAAQIDDRDCQLLHRWVTVKNNHGNSSLCPGYPWAGCCDFDPNMNIAAEIFEHVVYSIGREENLSIASDRNLTFDNWVRINTFNWRGQHGY